MASSSCFEIESWSRSYRTLLGWSNHTCRGRSSVDLLEAPRAVLKYSQWPHQVVWNWSWIVAPLGPTWIHTELIQPLALYHNIPKLMSTSIWAGLISSRSLLYLGRSQWRGGIVRLDSSDSLSLSRAFTATRRNHSTRFIGLFELI